MIYENDPKYKFANELVEKEYGIINQLKLLRKHRNHPEVIEYMKVIENYDFLTDYVKYVIDKYYYNKKNVVKKEKNCVERFHIVALHPIKILKKLDKPYETNLKVGDTFNLLYREVKIIEINKEYGYLIIDDGSDYKFDISIIESIINIDKENNESKNN